MSESIFAHTTSIAGLTCKPLSILSETIATQEMSMVRGGYGEDTRVPPEAPTHWLDQALNPQPNPRPTLSLDHPDNYVEPITNLDGPDNRPPPVTEEPFIMSENDYYGNQNNNGGSQNNNDEDGQNNNDEDGQNNDFESFWNFDFLDDGTEDECTVPLDCGDDDSDDDNDGSGLPDEENSEEGNDE